MNMCFMSFYIGKLPKNSTFFPNAGVYAFAGFVNVRVAVFWKCKSQQRQGFLPAAQRLGLMMLWVQGKGGGGTTFAF